MMLEMESTPGQGGAKQDAGSTETIITEPLANVNNGEFALWCLSNRLYPIPLCWPDEQGNCACGHRDRFGHPSPHADNQVGKAALIIGWNDRDDAGRFLLAPTEVNARNWWTRWPGANVGISLGASGILHLDPDSPEALAETLRRGTGITIRRKSRNPSYLYRRPEGCPITNTTKQGDSKKIDVLANGLVVVYGRHRKGHAIYLEGDDLIDAPEWAVAMLQEAKSRAASTPVSLPPMLPEVDVDALPLSQWIKGKIKDGDAEGFYKEATGDTDRSRLLFSIELSLIGAGIDDATIAGIVMDTANKGGEKAQRQGVRWLEGDLARAHARSTEGPTLHFNGNGHAANGDVSPTREATTRRWPDPLHDDAYYGLPGAIVRAIDPHTEGDPAAVMINLLVAFGNVVGRGAYTMVGPERHGLNLNAVIVGDTSKGRKGTSWGHPRELFRAVAPEWADNRILSGLSSGEGLIWAVRDPIEKTEAVKEKGQPTGEYQTIIVDQGVPDKRLLVLEGEFVTALKVMERDGNTLSSQVRLAWDHGNLQSLTKNSPAKATGAHISILGHVTRDELLRYLNDTETGNGFGNRFLWLCARRSKILPEGGGAPDYGELAFKLQAALDTARRLGAIERDDDAKRGWAEIYGDLSEGKQGLIGAVTARAEAQVTRLAALYAAFDGSKVINVSHLCAALAIWTYCEQSVAYIFGDATGDSVADRIVAALRANPEGMDKTDISRALGTHITGTRIDQALTVLLTTKLARRERIPPESGIGRPREVWYAA